MTAAVVMRASSGLVLRTPTESNIVAILESLPRGGHVILELEGESGENSHYAQAWLRPDGTFQLEYRDGQPSEHYQTRTISREKVAAALFGWVSGEASWRENFDWQSIGDRFSQQ
jgi:hypothetical protein